MRDEGGHLRRVAQIAFRAFGDTVVSFMCYGDNAGGNDVTIMAVDVRKITDKSR